MTIVYLVFHDYLFISVVAITLILHLEQTYSLGHKWEQEAASRYLRLTLLDEIFSQFWSKIIRSL